MKVYVLLYDGGVHEEAPEIQGVYTTLELATHAAKLYGGAEVQEILTDVIPAHPEGCYPYEVALYRDGRVKYVGLINVKKFEQDSFLLRNSFEWKLCILRFFAKDDEDAIQIARERGAEKIANGEWPPGWADRDRALTPLGTLAGTNE